MGFKRHFQNKASNLPILPLINLSTCLKESLCILQFSYFVQSLLFYSWPMQRFSQSNAALPSRGDTKPIQVNV